jgi:GNAT superfamily N-acetyltransferase
MAAKKYIREDLFFERVFSDEDEKICLVYEILKSCGKDMFENQGLMHWRKPYPQARIKKDCGEKEVFLVQEKATKQYVHTFQLEIVVLCSKKTFSEKAKEKKDFMLVIVNKFATSPAAQGKGFGKKSIDFIENYCKGKGINKLCLDVYDKSTSAVNFYVKEGFHIVGTKKTKYFNVYIMEKEL